MDTLIFGTGSLGRDCLRSSHNSLNIVGFLDNDDKLWGSTIEGIEVVSPDTIIKSNFDQIIIASSWFRQIREQLKTLGVPPEKITAWANANLLADQALDFDFNNPLWNRTPESIDTRNLAENEIQFARERLV